MPPKSSPTAGRRPTPSLCDPNFTRAAEPAGKLLSQRKLNPAWLIFACLIYLSCSEVFVRANVYPTNIKINDGFTNVTVAAGTSLSITYVLNEPASGGVLIKIESNNTVVRSIIITAGSPGTLRGANAVTWDGKDNNSAPVAAGTYSVAITAASKGYPVWTQTTDDNTNGNVVWEGRGIAVDQNTNSPYYGRIFVANAAANSQGLPDWLGYQVGIVKCNADGSFADEGGFSTGGYPWAGDGYSPWHIELSRDDFLYIDDYTTNGQVIRWDATVSTNSELPILRPDNWADLNVSLSGPALSGSGTNTALWMADATFSSLQTGLGILRYQLLPSGVCATNDAGTIAVAVGGSLTGNPVDVALDPAGNIYTIQANADPGDPSNRVFRFPPYDPSTNSAPLTNADWAIGSADDTMAGARGIAVDPTGTYVAVAFDGLSIGTNGCTQVFFATNGALVTNLDLGVVISTLEQHEDVACAWDAVGNVYYIDNYYGAWRAFSPPGTNEATTVALATVQVTGGGPVVQPKITNISLAGGIVTIEFSAGTNDLASAFTIQGATAVGGPYSGIGGATITSAGAGHFRATFPVGSGVEYFRISRQGSTTGSQPVFSKTSITGNTVTLSFSGGAGDTASSFTILSSATANGAYVISSNAIIAEVSPGQFQASIPVTGPVQFYRIRK
jgi:hypothetical protein